ncbi:MAG TPA: carboxymuconolactone decarboxylase family protein [Acidimicrobiales bacterium]
MTVRVEYQSWEPGFHAMLGMEKAIRRSGLERSLIELVKVRASQINGCAYCIDMHTKDARAAGETEQRLYALSAWRETPFFTDRERAALAFTESVTLLTHGHVTDAVIDEAKQHFDEEELVKLLYVVVTINAWNRLGVTAARPVGDYQPNAATHA